MRQAITSGAAVLAGALWVGAGSGARAVEVTVGDGIVVVDLTKEECRRVLDAVDATAAFADLVSPALPGEYRAAVKLAAGGWRVLRAVAAEPVPVRVIVTALPPVVLVLPGTGATAAEVVAAYQRLRERAAGPFRTAFARAARVIP